jgi:hypothetical protein
MSNDLLKNAFLQNNVEDVNIAVKAEDVQQNSGIDFSKHFFEAKVGSSYLIKLLPNPGDAPIVHRSVYKNLPDPERKGKTFHYVSSGNAKTCKALDLFFELNALKKAGDAIAEKKIEKYLGKTNQAAVKVQILQSPVAEEIGIIRMLTFATFGPNATVANLLNLKLNPTPEQIKQDFEKEDVFNIFSSSVLSLVCEEATYEGVKGRDFTKSSWAPKKRGALGIIEVDGKLVTREFKATDVVDGVLIKEAEPFFNDFVSKVTHDDYSIYNYFAYKEVDDARNTKETNDYLKNVNAKIDEIIPIIRDKSLTEIAVYGKATAAPTTGAPKEDKEKNVMENSLPDELANSIMKETVKESNESAEADEVGDILNAK